MSLFLVPVVLAVTAGLFVRFTVFSHDQIRRMRWRIRWHLHPGPGFASIAEMWFRWSRHAAIGHGRRARPGMGFHRRLTGRTTDYAVRLGRSQWFRRLYARLEDQVPDLRGAEDRQERHDRRPYPRPSGAGPGDQHPG